MSKATQLKINYYFRCFGLTARQRARLIKCCDGYSIATRQESQKLKKSVSRKQTLILKPWQKGEPRSFLDVDYWRSTTTIQSRKDWHWIPAFIRQAKLKPSQYSLQWSFLTVKRVNKYQVPDYIVELARRTQCQLAHSVTSIAGPALFQRPFLKLRLAKIKQPSILFTSYTLLIYGLSKRERKRLDSQENWNCHLRYPSEETRGRTAVEWVLWDARLVRAASRYLIRKRIPASACELVVHVIWDAYHCLGFKPFPEHVNWLIHSIGPRVRITMQEL